MHYVQGSKVSKELCDGKIQNCALVRGESKHQSFEYTFFLFIYLFAGLQSSSPFWNDYWKANARIFDINCSKNSSSIPFMWSFFFFVTQQRNCTLLHSVSNECISRRKMANKNKYVHNLLIEFLTNAIWENANLTPPMESSFTSTTKIWKCWIFEDFHNIVWADAPGCGICRKFLFSFIYSEHWKQHFIHVLWK